MVLQERRLDVFLLHGGRMISEVIKACEILQEFCNGERCGENCPAYAVCSKTNHDSFHTLASFLYYFSEEVQRNE